MPFNYLTLKQLNLSFEGFLLASDKSSVYSYLALVVEQSYLFSIHVRGDSNSLQNQIWGQLIIESVIIK